MLLFAFSDPVNGVYASIENSSDLLAEELPDPVEVSVPTVDDDFQATVIDVVIGNENEASAPDLGNATTLLCSHANPLTDF